eukprot:6097883-Pleurochrysis_carterae.AAC.1
MMRTSRWCKNELNFRRLQKVRNFFRTAFHKSEVSLCEVGIVGKIRQKAFVKALRGVMNRRMDEASLI